MVTAAGRAALDEAFQWYGQLLAQAMDGWSPDEISTLDQGLGRFIAALATTLGTHETTEVAPVSELASASVSSVQNSWRRRSEAEGAA